MSYSPTAYDPIDLDDLCQMCSEREHDNGYAFQEWWEENYARTIFWLHYYHRAATTNLDIHNSDDSEILNREAFNCACSARPE